MSNHAKLEAFNLLLGIVFLYNAISGLRSGKVGSMYGSVRKADRPGEFWTAVIGSGVLAVCIVVWLLVSVVQRGSIRWGKLGESSLRVHQILLALERRGREAAAMPALVAITFVPGIVRKVRG